MTPPAAIHYWRLGWSVVRIAQELTRAAGHDVSIGDVCAELARAGVTSRPAGPCVYRPKIRHARPMGSR